MLIERLLRDRGTAIQSGPSDVGLFGATGDTFQNWTPGSVVAMSLGSARPALASDESGGGSSGYSPGHAVSLAGETHFSTNALASLDQGMIGGSALTGAVHTHVDIGLNANYAAATTVPLAVSPIPVGSGTQFDQTVHVGANVAVETSAAPATAAVVSNVAEAAQTQTAQTMAVLDDAHAAAAAQLEQLSAALASDIAALKEQTDAAIAALTSEAAEQVAALQQTVAGLAEPVVDTVAVLPGALVQQVDGLATGLVPPVLDTLATLPGTIGTATDLSVSTHVGAEIALGGQEIGVDLGTSLSTATALDMDLPISGSDVAGGISTLVDMIGNAAGFVVQDAASGVEWLGDALAPADSLAALADDHGVDLTDDHGLGLPDMGGVDPGAILLGIADHGTDLLGGLSSFDDHGHG